MGLGHSADRSMKWGRWPGLVLLVIAAVNCVNDSGDETFLWPLPQHCTNDAHCDDANPCTNDECLPDEICANTAVANGSFPGQTVGDCRRDDCVEGLVVSTNDDTDLPNDGEPCTTDSCSDGTVLHLSVVDGTLCPHGSSTGMCSTGICEVLCVPFGSCNDDNPCTEDTCVKEGTFCVYDILDGIPTPGFPEPLGDCKIHICANGVDLAINDDADVLDDMNPCTLNVCMAGIPSNPYVSEGTACAPGDIKVCNGQGVCVECTESSHCGQNPGAVCVDNVCCDTNCDGLCQACSASRKGIGLDGVCGFIVKGNDPDAECVGPMACDGAGVCQ